MDGKVLLATNPLLSDRTRLAILATLAAASVPLEFNALLSALGLTKGNLSSHVRKLEDAGLISVGKEFVDRKPRTTYSVTPLGETSLQEYLRAIENLLTGTISAKK